MLTSELLPFKVVILLAIFISNTVTVLLPSGTCRQADGSTLCCKGRKLTCQGRNLYHRFHAANNSRSPSNCFCDEYCTFTGDCCVDYRRLCAKPKIDCKVGNWNQWSHCSKKCGNGTQSRTRSVLLEARNGGLSCPLLTETRSCLGRICPNTRYSRSGSRMLELMDLSSEVANLLPHEGDVEQKIRSFDMRWDIRRKLYLLSLIKQNKTEIKDPEPYCIHYEIIQANSACRKGYLDLRNLNYQNLFYQPAHVAPSKDFVEEPVRESVIRTFQREFPKLHLKSKRYLQPHQRICATCYPQYMRKELGNRCPGAGYPGIVSRWRALQTEDCQGTFRMVSSPRRSCSCPIGLSSFILT